ncbi:MULTISPECIES: ABC transporter permease [Aerococcus]|uniref:ABC transporter permease n=1 Tax=Aerococcus TaxID=1375 RepID=UPI00227C53C7|nr:MULTISPECIES: ABC transporter permease [Aerococcus]MCY3035586.1 ABC transporter permease [Aerococcus sp. Group 2]MCY3039260.1 ABC transporter permease [Aerococcus sp. Group 2]MCY3041162.1 ABC transporter permease [Aerococcus sp. Group 2]MCY3042399.1 ABC transporter permease [Aerococcus sp. Group 2]MDK6520981.1 FtsX-like permease family protein [Aerococcus urinae]
MNKKNLPIFISLLIVSLFFTVIFYYGYTNISSSNRQLKATNFYDARLSEDLSQEEIAKLNQMEAIDLAGGTSARAHSAKYKDHLISMVGQDVQVKQMREESYLLAGRFPESADEIVLNESLVKQEDLSLGDELAIELGERQVDGKTIDARSTYTAEESFETTERRHYTLVGVYKDFYNENLKINYGMPLVDDDEVLIPLINFHDFKAAYAQSEAIQDEIQDLLGKEVELDFNDSLVRYYGLDVSQSKNLMTKLVNALSLLLCMGIFVFFIKNIFWVWGLQKIRELSMYKSIGSTNFQIYLLLVKGAVTVSVLPVLIGHVLGFFLIRYLFEVANSGKAEVVFFNQVHFNWILSLVIILVALAVVLVAVIYPARKIAKIDIIEGLKGNFSLSKKKGKKRSSKLWKELRLNNMASIKSQRYISAIGILIVAIFCIVYAIADYNRDFYAFDDGYDLTVHYYNDTGELPPILPEILADYEGEGYISKEKNLAIEPNLELSQTAQSLGLDEQLEQMMADTKPQYIRGILVALKNDDLQKLGGSPGEFTLYNQVQADPNEPLAQAEKVPYFDHPDQLEVSINEKRRSLPIAQTIDDLGPYQTRILPFNVMIYTDFETYQELMEAAQDDKNFNYPFELKLKLPEGQAGRAKEEITSRIENTITYNESFKVFTDEEIQAEQFTDIQSFKLIIYGIAAIIFLMNITNGYSSINLSLMNRRKEIGTLYSIGMDIQDLRNHFSREFLFEQGKSFLLSVLITLGIMLGIAGLFKSVDMKSLILYFPYLVFLGFSLLVYGLNLLIYWTGLSAILNHEPIDLIRGI